MDTIENRVNELISIIKEKLAEMKLDAEKVFINGNCGDLHTIFADYFKKEAVVPYEITYQGRPVYIMSKIGDDLYDITGKTSLEKYVDYIEKNSDYFYNNKKDYGIREIEVGKRERRIAEQSNKYGYDDNFGEPQYPYAMKDLKEYIQKIKEEKENEK